jgi:hypothetical protein
LVLLFLQAKVNNWSIGLVCENWHYPPKSWVTLHVQKVVSLSCRSCVARLKLLNILLCYTVKCTERQPVSRNKLAVVWCETVTPMIWGELIACLPSLNPSSLRVTQAHWLFSELVTEPIAPSHDPHTVWSGKLWVGLDLELHH